MSETSLLKTLENGKFFVLRSHQIKSGGKPKIIINAVWKINPNFIESFLKEHWRFPEKYWVYDFNGFTDR